MTTNIKRKKPIERRFELKTLKNMSKCADCAILGTQALSTFAWMSSLPTTTQSAEALLLSSVAVGAISLANYKLMKKNNDFKKKIGMLEMPTSKLERVMKNYNINNSDKSKIRSITKDARYTLAEFAGVGALVGCIACSALNSVEISPALTAVCGALTVVLAFDACTNQKKINTNIKVLGKKDSFRIKFTSNEKDKENVL